MGTQKSAPVMRHVARRRSIKNLGDRSPCVVSPRNLACIPACTSPSPLSPSPKLETSCSLGHSKQIHQFSCQSCVIIFASSHRTVNKSFFSFFVGKKRKRDPNFRGPIANR